MAIIANIAISLLVASVLTLLVFLILTKLKGNILCVGHIIGLACLFVFIGVQTFLFCWAIDERRFVEDKLQTLNAITETATGYISNTEQGERLLDEVKANFDGHTLNPILNLWGIEMGSDDKLTTTEKLNSYYNTYLWKKTAWIVGAVIVYVVISLFLTPNDTPARGRDSSSRRRYESTSARTSRTSRRPSSRI